MCVSVCLWALREYELVVTLDTEGITEDKLCLVNWLYDQGVCVCAYVCVGGWVGVCARPSHFVCAPIDDQNIALSMCDSAS